MIVSFSGIDSAGKTTQIDLLCSYFDQNKINYVKKWSKARGTPGVEFVKRLVRRDKGFDEDSKKEYRAAVYENPKKKKLLFSASMLDLCWYWGVHYRLLNCTHRYLICDRYLWDTFVELHSDFKGIDIENAFLWKVVKKLAPKPKISFVFVIPPEVSIERDIQKNAAGIDDMEVKKAKINAYLQLVDQNKWTNVMDGLKPISEIHGEILGVLGL